jgi:hypothetical protein
MCQYVNIERLRKDLMDEYGTAMEAGNELAMVDLIEVENASPEELIQIAKELEIDLSLYAF